MPDFLLAAVRSLPSAAAARVHPEAVAARRPLKPRGGVHLRRISSCAARHTAGRRTFFSALCAQRISMHPPCPPYRQINVSPAKYYISLPDHCLTHKTA